MKTKIKNKLRLVDLLKPHLLALYLLIIVGAYLRLQAWLTNSFAFTYDVGRDMLALSSIAHLEKLPLIGPTTGIQGVFYGPWWYYFLTPAFIVFSGNPSGIALVLSLIGILCIPMGYILGKKIESRSLGLIIAAIIMASPVLISLSSQIWNPNVAPIFVILVILTLTQIFKNGEKISRFYFLLGLLLAGCFDIEIVFGLFFSLGVLLTMIILLKSKIKPSDILWFLFGIIIVILPRVIFEIRHQFLMTQSFIKFLTVPDPSVTVRSLADTIINRADIFLNLIADTVGGGNKIFATIIILITIFVIAMFFKKIKMYEKNILILSLIVIGTFFLGMVFFKHEIWPHYLVGLPVFFILILSIALNLLRRQFAGALPLIIIIIIMAVNINLLNIISNVNRPLFIGDAAVYRNQLEVLDYIYNDAKSNKFKYVVYTPPVHDYTYRYLFDWYGPNRYGYSPSQKASIAYFIIEPDYELPSRITDWLKIREGDGKIIKAKTMPSGIVIQKRISL